SYTDQFKLYVGPIDEDYLVKAQEGLEDVRQIALRSFIAPIDNLMLKLLKGFHFLVPNYGIAIILLTLLVKVLMFPLYHKQMESMRKMQALQPHINALKEQYKDDAQKLQKEQMELFKKHKVNPLAGCLTMLPMLPIFIALYATFGMSVELRGEPFLWWITDLSAPDSAFYLPIGSSIITINILPIAYAILMIWSTSLQKMEGPNATMMKVLPLIFVFIFWNIASGVILYFVVNIFIDLVQRIITEKLYPSEPIPVSGPKKE
ncbi:MAG: membrane protein insertase YidC, partial [bacterium]|nr:membrane protein insertase YidC [bacterium]